jgi:tRNA-dihydrouridine synthase
MQNIWASLPKPFTVLAPMDDVTDVVFRSIVRESAAPDLFFTEFTNVEALCSAGKTSQIRRLTLDTNDHPIIAQIWGKEPEHYAQATTLIKEMGFDGVDINMGCPQHDVIKNGSCSALIHNHELAHDILVAVQQAADDLPVSVKTRIGLKEIETEDWIGFLLEHNLQAISVHGRTAKEMSLVPAHWDEIGKAVQLRDAMKKETIIVGNGDVKNWNEAIQKHKEFGVDGVMIGRGIFANMWAFEKDQTEHHPRERIQLLRLHIERFRDQWESTKQYDILKRFYKIYMTGFEGAHDLRNELMMTKRFEEALQVVDKAEKLLV